jgi:hypothetical protein
MITIAGDNFNKLALGVNNCHNFKGHNEFTNVAFRIAYYLHVMRGANDLKSLMFHSDHMKDFSDNGRDLRGSIGPRMRFWVGADQLQEAITINQDIDDEKEFVRPEGVDQLRLAYTDLASGMSEASISIRDPAIDFEDTNDIPDLVSIQFHVLEKTYENHILCMALMYGEIKKSSNFINELWVMLQVSHMYKDWLHCQSVQINICSLCESNDINIEEIFSNENDFGDTPDGQFQKDLEMLIDTERHIRSQIVDHSKTKFVSDKSKALLYGDIDEGNYIESVIDVGLSDCINVAMMLDELTESLVDKIQNKYLREMAIVLMVCAACKLDGIGHEEFIIKSYKSLETPLRIELAEYLLEANLFSTADTEMFSSDLNG